MGLNQLIFDNCLIKTKSNFGILQHDYNNNKSYVRLSVLSSSIEGNGALSRNGYDSGMLNVEEFTSNTNISSSVGSYASSSNIICKY